jgi:predicted MFS family arabinose efflux permease
VNCLVAFLVTPSIGKHLGTIGVKFAFVSGLFGGGVCCALSGFLEFFEPGLEFFVMSVLIRIIHAVANAMVITSTFTYTACEFPTAVAKIFSMTRCVMNVAQLGGPALGGLMYEAGGFFCPFMIMGSIQILLSLLSVFFMPLPEAEEEGEDDCLHDHKKKKNKVSVLNMLSIPTVWFSFAAFIIATMCNGFLSLNLEPQVLRAFSFSPFYVGLLFGLKDGANSLASPFWGWICDRNKKSVKPYLIIGSVLVAGSFFLMGAGSTLGLDFQLTIPLLIFALCLNGAGIGGQQVRCSQLLNKSI